MKFLVGLALSLWCACTLAEIRIVRGGGLAEMQIISLHQTLDQYIRVCIQNTNPCRLNANEASEYYELYKNHKRDSQGYTIEFVPRLSSGKLYELRHNTIILASTALYNQKSEAFENRYLLAIIASVRLDLLPSKNSFEQNLRRSIEIFQNLQQSHSASRASWSRTLLVIHSYDIKFEQYRAKKIFLEDSNTTLEITADVAQRLPCGTIQDWQFTGWKSTADGERAYFFASARSACANSRGLDPVLVVSAVLNKQGNVVPNSIEVGTRF